MPAIKKAPAKKKASGAKNRKSKLIKGIASRPGQLKISNIFKNSIETVCQKKPNDSVSSINGQGCSEKVQGGTDPKADKGKFLYSKLQ